MNDEFYLNLSVLDTSDEVNHSKKVNTSGYGYGTLENRPMLSDVEIGSNSDTAIFNQIQETN